VTGLKPRTYKHVGATGVRHGVGLTTWNDPCIEQDSELRCVLEDRRLWLPTPAPPALPAAPPATTPRQQQTPPMNKREEEEKQLGPTLVTYIQELLNTHHRSSGYRGPGTVWVATTME
jgi:hypothetical protein